MTYRLYLDEVGTDDLTHVSDERHRYLSLNAVIIEQGHCRDHAIPNMAKFKSDIFKHDPEEPVILHRSDIIYKNGPFGILAEDATRAKFDAGLLTYLRTTQYSVITAVIDKLGMMNQGHWENKHPYHYLMEIIVEKYTQWLERHNNSTGDIMPEKRRGPKDPALQKAFEEVRRAGTHFVSSDRIRSRIPSGELKFRGKRENVAGLQICDLFAHPSQCHVRIGQGHQITPGVFARQMIGLLTELKYDRSNGGTIRGYGTKYLP